MRIQNRDVTVSPSLFLSSQGITKSCFLQKDFSCFSLLCQGLFLMEDKVEREGTVNNRIS